MYACVHRINHYQVILGFKVLLAGKTIGLKMFLIFEWRNLTDSFCGLGSVNLVMWYHLIVFD